VIGRDWDTVTEDVTGIMIGPPQDHVRHIKTLFKRAFGFKTNLGEMANTSAVIPVAALCADARNRSVNSELVEERSSGKASSGGNSSTSQEPDTAVERQVLMKQPQLQLQDGNALATEDDVVVLDSSDDEGRSGGGAGGRASQSPPRASRDRVGGAGRSSTARKRRRTDDVVDLTNVADDPASPRRSGCEESDHDSDIVIVAEEPAQEHSARVGGAAGKAPKDQEEEEEEPPVSMDCTVCLGGIREATVTKCWHVFCNACIRDWLKKKNDCPICRKKVLLRDLHRIMAT